MEGRLAVCLALGLAGCLHDSLERCGDLLCPATATCIADRCVPRDALAVCADVPDGGRCSTTQIAMGDCIAGVCTEPTCGNGVVDSGELCDGDGCAPDCQAIAHCPALGQTPVFGTQFQQLPVTTCTDLTTSLVADRATASCNGQISEGPADGEMTPIAELQNTQGDYYVLPRLVPEGDELWLYHYDANAMATIVSSRHGDTGWSHPTTVMALANSGYYFGRPSQGPVRRFFLNDAVAGAVREKEVDESGQVREVAVIPWANLGLSSMSYAPNLSADALHMIVTGYSMPSPSTYQYVVNYIDRATPDAPFEAPRALLTTTTATYDLFLSDNCEHLYVGALGSQFYVRQIGVR